MCPHDIQHPTVSRTEKKESASVRNSACWVSRRRVALAFTIIPFCLRPCGFQRRAGHQLAFTPGGWFFMAFGMCFGQCRVQYPAGASSPVFSHASPEIPSLGIHLTAGRAGTSICQLCVFVEVPWPVTAAAGTSALGTQEPLCSPRAHSHLLAHDP